MVLFVLLFVYSFRCYYCVYLLVVSICLAALLVVCFVLRLLALFYLRAICRLECLWLFADFWLVVWWLYHTAVACCYWLLVLFGFGFVYDELLMVLICCGDAMVWYLILCLNVFAFVCCYRFSIGLRLFICVVCCVCLLAVYCFVF